MTLMNSIKIDLILQRLSICWLLQTMPLCSIITMVRPLGLVYLTRRLDEEKRLFIFITFESQVVYLSTSHLTNMSIWILSLNYFDLCIAHHSNRSSHIIIMTHGIKVESLPEFQMGSRQRIKSAEPKLEDIPLKLVYLTSFIFLSFYHSNHSMC